MEPVPLKFYEAVTDNLSKDDCGQLVCFKHRDLARAVDRKLSRPVYCVSIFQKERKAGIDWFMTFFMNTHRDFCEETSVSLEEVCRSKFKIKTIHLTERQIIRGEDAIRFDEKSFALIMNSIDLEHFPTLWASYHTAALLKIFSRVPLRRIHLLCKEQSCLDFIQAQADHGMMLEASIGLMNASLQLQTVLERLFRQPQFAELNANLESSAEEVIFDEACVARLMADWMRDPEQFAGKKLSVCLENAALLNSNLKMISDRADLTQTIYGRMTPDGHFLMCVVDYPNMCEFTFTIRDLCL